MSAAARAQRVVHEATASASRPASAFVQKPPIQATGKWALPEVMPLRSQGQNQRHSDLKSGSRYPTSSSMFDFPPPSSRYGDRSGSMNAAQRDSIPPMNRTRAPNQRPAFRRDDSAQSRWNNGRQSDYAPTRQPSNYAANSSLPQRPSRSGDQRTGSDSLSSPSRRVQPASEAFSPAPEPQEASSSTNPYDTRRRFAKSSGGSLVARLKESESGRQDHAPRPAQREKPSKQRDLRVRAQDINRDVFIPTTISVGNLARLLGVKQGLLRVLDHLCKLNRSLDEIKTVCNDECWSPV